MKSKPFTVTHVYDLLIRAVYEYRFLTCVQATTLLYKPGMLTTVRSRLKTLADNGYLLPVQLPTVRGQSPLVYTLARKGITYLASCGMEARTRFRPIEEKEKSYAFLMHSLKTTDVLIAASSLPTLVPGIRVHEIRHEHELNHTPLIVPREQKGVQGIPGKGTITIIPDAWLDIRVSRENKKVRRFTIWLELDRGTIEAKQFKRKLRGIGEAVSSGVYEKQFQAKSVQVAFATTAGDKRVQQMQTWTREISSSPSLKENSILSEMVLFTSLPQIIDPHSLFCTPVWHTAFQEKELVALLGGLLVQK